MRRSITVLAGVLVAALLLAACDISVGPPNTPRAPDLRVTANSAPDTAVRQLDIPAGADRLIEIAVPSGLPGPALYVELGGNLELSVAGANRLVLASSRSPAFFGRGSSGLSPAGLEAQSITTSITCRGSCVILDANAHSTVYALVRNTTGSRQVVPLFAYTDVYTDEYEPANNRPDSAPSLQIAFGLSESGAIERIGDEDYWFVSQSGYIRFDASNPAVELRAAVVDASGRQLGQAYVPGSRIFLNAGEYFAVWALDDRAAASANSRYDISYDGD